MSATPENEHDSAQKTQALEDAARLVSVAQGSFALVGALGLTALGRAVWAKFNQGADERFLADLAEFDVSWERAGKIREKSEDISKRPAIEEKVTENIAISLEKTAAQRLKSLSLPHNGVSRGCVTVEWGRV